MASSSKRAGRCLCGAITFEFTPKENHFDACHCSMCRRWSGGPGLAITADGSPIIQGTEHLETYASSDWGQRKFCKTCGTHLFWAAPEYGYFGISVGSLDDLDGLEFTKQIFVDEKPRQYAFANNTAMMTGAEVEAMFAEGGETD